MSESNGKPKRRIYLGMPGYDGKCTAHAGRAFWRACADMSQVVNDYRSGSLLACNFNQLWCGALNEVHEGRRLDYFAMLHGDIGAKELWLDELIAELEAHDLDILGVAVPLKDTRGITSLALHKEGDSWMPECRLSMQDLYQLPETFTSKDVGRPLLLNTGCWVCKFDMKWATQLHFEINDRIVFNRAQNRYQAQTESEDWFFSREAHELGLKIGATRKIPLLHRGDMDFPNTQPWGSHAFDSEHAKLSPVPGAFPRDIQGWLYPEEGQALSKLATGKRVLEIGSYCGLSTVCLARTAKHVTAVDYWDGRGTPNPRNTLDEFQANIARHGLSNKVMICHAEAEIPLPEYDLAFIDGAHDRESVLRDMHRSMEVLAPGGLLVFHDYSSLDRAVQMAVDELLEAGGELISTHKTLAVVRPPAAIPMEI
jgi:precorrin-6B methylase 2